MPSKEDLLLIQCYYRGKHKLNELYLYWTPLTTVLAKHFRGPGKHEYSKSQVQFIPPKMSLFFWMAMLFLPDMGRYWYHRTHKRTSQIHNKCSSLSRWWFSDTSNCCLMTSDKNKNYHLKLNRLYVNIYELSSTKLYPVSYYSGTAIDLRWLERDLRMVLK
jgi:hypothetical protein